MRLALLLLPLLAYVSRCASFLCSLQDPGPFTARPLPVGIPSVESIAPLTEEGNDFLIVSRPSSAPLATELTRLSPNSQERAATIRSLFGSDAAPLLVTRDRHWWFATEGEERTAGVAYFVVGGETAKTIAVNLPYPHRLVWMPVPGEEPSAILVSVAAEQPALRFHRVTPAGATVIATLPWWQTAEQFTIPLPSRWSAAALDDGRLAVVAIDGSPETRSLMLRVIGGNREPVEAALPCATPIDYPLATAVDDRGRLAIAGTSADGRVVAHLGDPKEPRSFRCRVISAGNVVAAKPPFGSPAVTWAGDRFVVAWVGEDRRVRACDLKNLDVAPIVVDIGEDADVELPLRQLLYAGADRITLVWKQRGGGLMIRRLPHAIAGYAFGNELLKGLCGNRVVDVIRR